MAYVLVACQAVLLPVFAASAVGKLRGVTAWSAFVGSVRDLRLVPLRLVKPAAAGVVAGEAVAVPLLAVPLTVPVGLVLAGGLLAVFTVSIVATVRRGVRAVCRCFGGSAALPLGIRHLVRNGVLLAVVALGVVSLVLAGGPPELAGAVMAAGAGLLVAVVLILFDEIVELFAGPPVGAGQREQRRA